MSSVASLIPWIILFLVFAGMALLLWRALASLDDLAKLLAQLLGQAAPKVVTLPAPTVTAVKPDAPLSAPIPVQPAATGGAFDNAPAWFKWALHEVGVHEDAVNRGAAVARYASLAHAGGEGDPWCAIFANAALESSNVAGSRSASSQSFRANPNFVQLQGPALGAIAVFWRGTPDSGLGHVGFYRGEDASRVWTLGGNENDMVQIEALPKSSSSFGLIGYWWPRAVPLPTGGAVIMPAGSSVSVQQQPAGASSSSAVAVTPNGKQTKIIATMFGGESSAYGGAIDDAGLGVALPFRFSGQRPTVRVTNVKTGVSIDCAIVDVGPWNTNDPYWQTGARPQAESGADRSGRRTNGAGIDLTFAAAKALQIDGKGLVDWEFLQSPNAAAVAAPNVV